LKTHISHNEEPHYETIVKMLGIRFNEHESQYEIQCKWRNFGHEEPTWEPIDIIQKDVPEMLQNFLKNFHDLEIAEKAAISLQK